MNNLQLGTCLYEHNFIDYGEPHKQSSNCVHWKPIDPVAQDETALERVYRKQSELIAKVPIPRHHGHGGKDGKDMEIPSPLIQVKRYALAHTEHIDHYDNSMQLSPEGDYVLYEEYAVAFEQIEKLRKLAPSWASRAIGETHYEECWREHRLCAMAKIEELRNALGVEAREKQAALLKQQNIEPK